MKNYVESYVVIHERHLHRQDVHLLLNYHHKRFLNVHLVHLLQSEDRVKNDLLLN
jgi:hypothetical protein